MYILTYKVPTRETKAIPRNCFMLLFTNASVHTIISITITNLSTGVESSNSKRNFDITDTVATIITDIASGGHMTGLSMAKFGV